MNGTILKQQEKNGKSRIFLLTAEDLAGLVMSRLKPSCLFK
jgi:hypothetical protein